MAHFKNKITFTLALYFLICPSVSYSCHVVLFSVLWGSDEYLYA